MSEIVDLDSRRDWSTSAACCSACGHRWQAVFPGAPAKLECPACHQIQGEFPPQVEIGNLGFEDIGAAFNMRGWLQKACETAGGKMTGGGFGDGVADIWVEIEGHTFEVTIKPVLINR